MTLTDSLIPYYVWFKYGFGEISLPMAMVNMALLITTLLTVKGFFISLYVVPFIAVGVIFCCISVGYFMAKYDIYGRMTTQINQNQNKEFMQLCDDVKYLKENCSEVDYRIDRRHDHIKK